MRYLPEVSIRFVGDKELGKQFIPLGRKVLGGVVNRDSEIGGLDQSVSRKRYDNGLYIEAGYVGTLPFINIDVSGVKEEPKDFRAPLFTISPTWKQKNWQAGEPQPPSFGNQASLYVLDNMSATLNRRFLLHGSSHF